MNEATFWINVTDNCNLQCTYCYQEKRGMNNLNKETANFIIDTIVKYKSNIIKIIFFGGEPILNFDIIRYFVNEFSKKENLVITYFTTTNLTILNEEIINFFNINNFSIMVSIDGNEQTYKLNRKNNYNDINYFEIVYNNLLKLQNSSKLKVSISKVVTENNYYNLFKDTQFLCEFNYPIYYNFEFDTEMFTEKNVELKKQLEQTFIYYLEKKRIGKLITLNYFDGFIETFKNLFTATKGLQEYSCCNFEKFNFAFDTEGKIYPCHFFIESNENRYNSKSIDNVKKLVEQCSKFSTLDEIEKFSKMKSIFEVKKCITCDYQYGCYESFLNIIDNSCHLDRFKLRNGLMVKKEEPVFCVRHLIFDMLFDYINKGEIEINDFI